jgi:hypothetical protein
VVWTGYGGEGVGSVWVVHKNLVKIDVNFKFLIFIAKRAIGPVPELVAGSVAGQGARSRMLWLMGPTSGLESGRDSQDPRDVKQSHFSLLTKNLINSMNFLNLLVEDESQFEVLRAEDENITCMPKKRRDSNDSNPRTQWRKQKGRIGGGHLPKRIIFSQKHKEDPYD